MNNKHDSSNTLNAHPRRLRCFIWCVAACITSFGFGFLTSDCRLDGRVEKLTGQRIVEFVQWADSLGVVDHEWAQELFVIASEAAWEDLDVEQQEKGGKP